MKTLSRWPLILMLILLPVALRADAPASQPLTDDQKIAAWWDDLAKNEPESSRALLNLSTKPDQVIPFLKEHLKPLTITEDEVRTLISNLGSDDESIWKPAFDKLSYYDPRLAIELEPLVNGTNEPIVRNRLVDILCDVPADTYAGKTIALHKFTEEKNYNFVSNKSSWWAEWQVSRLSTEIAPKKQWTRAKRAIVLLEHFNTPEAKAILQDMAAGHPDAAPTKAAKEALESLEKNER